MADTHTETEEALEEQFGLQTDFPYALRADQLADGTYRYALEHAQTGEVVAEAADPDDSRALEQFRQSLAGASLTGEAREALRTALARYDNRVHS